MFKTETHLHVSEVSPCAKISAYEMIKLYSEAGYHTVFVSDHLKKKFYDKLEDMPWEEKTENFLSGYEAAKKAGEEFGVNVLLSAEILLSNSPNHYLLYGIDRNFLNKRQDLFDMEIEEFYSYAKANGVTVIQAHPYRDGKNTPADAAFVDAVEIMNTNPRHENFTDKAIAWAKENRLPMTAGSDAHRYEDIAGTGIISSCEIKSVEDYIRLVMNEEIEIIG